MQAGTMEITGTSECLDARIAEVARYVFVAYDGIVADTRGQ